MGLFKTYTLRFEDEEKEVWKKLKETYLEWKKKNVGDLNIFLKELLKRSSISLVINDFDEADWKKIQMFYRKWSSKEENFNRSMNHLFKEIILMGIRDFK